MDTKSLLCRFLLKWLRPVLDGFDVTMHKDVYETGSQIPRPLGREIWCTVRTSLSALWLPRQINGQVRLGGAVRNNFLCVQFWIRVGTVSNRGKKVRTVDSPVVWPVNKSRDTRNCVQNEPKYAICVLVATRLYYKALWIILCALM